MLAVNNLHLRYGIPETLRGVSFFVEEGQIAGIIGGGGAGKSSVLRCIAGLTAYQQGNIVFCGIPLPSLAHKVAERGIALAPDGRKLFLTQTVDQNLRIGARPDADLSTLIARQYALFPWLDALRDQTVESLAIGERQLLLIARAMMTRPRLLLIDEPPHRFAPPVADEIFRAIPQIRANGVTVLVALQDTARVLQIADYAVLLDGGRVVRTGHGRDFESGTVHVHAGYEEVRLSGAL